MEIKFVSAKEFKEIERKEGVGVLKQFTSEVAPSGERILEFTISTAARDRDNDIINPEGWIFDNYLKNPVVLFAHAYDEPAVGRTLEIWVENGKVKARAEFTPQEIYPFGYTIYLLYKEGFMNAVSVGFIPIEYKELDQGYHYLKQELLEYSMVPVGSNPEALITAKRKGIDISPVVRWAENVLEKAGYNSVITKEVYENIKMAEKDKEVKVFDIEAKSVIPYKRTPLADMEESWDAAAEVAAAEVEDLKIMCTWYDSRNPDVKSSYKLPHHKVEGQHACVWRGVVAAMAALMGARGGVDIPNSDRKGVYNHLAKHYEDFGKEPPEFKEYTEEELKELFPELYIEEIEEEIEAKEVVEEDKEAVKDAEVSTKWGRVLSAANEAKIRKAVELLQEVLAQLDADVSEESVSSYEEKISGVVSEEEESITEEEIIKLVNEILQEELNKITGKIS